MKLNKITTAISIALFANATQAATQLDQVIVSATKTQQSLDSVTSNVYVITAEEIEAKHYKSVTQLLNTVPGISFTTNGGFGKSTSVFVRGFDSGRVLLMLDGVRLNDNTRTTGGAPYQHIMLNDIERVEVIKGAQSGIWGADATAGVINIITKKATKELQSRVNVEAGSYGTKQINATFSKASDKFDMSLNLSKIESAGHTARAPRDVEIDSLEADGYANTTVRIKTGVNVTAKDRLELSHTRIDAATDIDRGSSDPSGFNTHKQNITQLAYIHKNQDSTITVKHQRNLVDRDDPGGFTKEFDSETIENSVQYDRAISDSQWLTIGANQTEFESKNDINKRYNNRGLFVSHSHKINDTTLNEVLRLDSYDAFTNQTTYKFGLKHPVNKDVTVSANYGTAYNVPTLYQKYSAFGNANLTPESTQSADVSVAWKELSVTVFDNRIDNLLDFDNGSFAYVNVPGLSTSRGYEIEYRRSFGTIDLAVNYAHVETATNNANVNFTLRRAKDQIGVDITWFANDKLDVNLAAQYIDERPKGYWDSKAGTEHYTVMNTTMNYQLDKDVSAYLKIDNMFDQYYQIIDGYATAGRSTYLGMNINF